MTHACLRHGGDPSAVGSEEGFFWGGGGGELSARVLKASENSVSEAGSTSLQRLV